MVESAFKVCAHAQTIDVNSCVSYANTLLANHQTLSGIPLKSMHAAHPDHSPTAQAERNVVEAMTKCKKPDIAGLQQLVTPVGTEIQAADKLTQVQSSMCRAADTCQYVSTWLPVTLLAV